MKQLNEYITEKFKISSKNISSKNIGHKYNYHPKDKDELEKLIFKLIKERGLNADLNDIDVSKITDMSNLFSRYDKNYNYGYDERSEYFCKFNGNISEWDVSNVKNMENMFYYSSFNGDISNWDVSNVKDMKYMFCNCYNFNCNLSNWNISNVKDMENMFFGSHLQKNPPSWYHE